MEYFTLDEAAIRYDFYRPKVHGIVKDWLIQAGVELKFENVVDIACGTGDSTVPLLEFGKNVVGIDQSKSMLKKAKEKGLTVKQAGFEEAYQLGPFDLISTCMAFHWFDFNDALAAYKKASSSNAIWLIYNFTFGGSAQSNEFNEWYVGEYMRDYPSPPRNKQIANFDGVEGLQLLSKSNGVVPIVLSRNELVKYLTTQSNIEAKVKSGLSYAQIESDLEQQLNRFELDTEFRYNFTYDIYQYQGNE
ncbi:class I SAM-dependent methyltransferase [Reinekea forsetii]|nr:class I SAM-dependent methyltransferase [Reinekea forsetii]